EQTELTDGYVALRLSGETPATAAEATVNLTLRSIGEDGGGTVYVDNVSLYYGEETPEPLKAPYNFRIVQQTYQKIEFTWDPPVDNVEIMGYEVYQDDIFLGTITTNTYTAKGLQPRKWYKFSVRAFDNSGNYSELIDFRAATFGANLINNWSFEEFGQSADIGTGWSKITSDGSTANFGLVQSPVYNGHTAQKIVGTGMTKDKSIGIKQDIKVKPELSFSMKALVNISSLTNSQLEYSVDFADENGVWIDRIYLERKTVTGGYILLTTSGKVPKQATTASINLVIKSTGNGGTGTAFIDALEFSYTNTKATYQYNSSNQLESITYSDGSKVLYKYDANGNILEIKFQDI
ncbi:fibronectin type III domain-containing protein, partial [Paenibacillus sp. M1]